jgi:hypothetical protein
VEAPRADTGKTTEVLRSPAPPPKQIVPRRVAQSPFSPGDVLCFQTGTGREVALWAMQNGTHRSLTVVDTNTGFQLVAVGNPQLPALGEIVSAEPLLITNRAGHSELLQFTFVLPQDAQGPRWHLIGNVPFSQDRIGSSYTIIVVNKGRGSAPTGADAYFEALFLML